MIDAGRADASARVVRARAALPGGRLDAHPNARGQTMFDAYLLPP